MIGTVLGAPLSEETCSEDIWSQPKAVTTTNQPGGSKHLLVGDIAGQHCPAPQVHQPNELEDIEGW